ncbi:MAG: TM2 domain-containing protein [Bacteroidales bacterium]|mgnify:CR=1 FL=1|nr:TM2 domain-containing protein [Bacteroidales bacterium]
MAEENVPQASGQKEPQPKTLMIIICLFLGCYGIHRLMMGYEKWWLQLITLGGCGFWAIYDFIMIITDKMPMADGTPLKKE